MSAVLVLGGTGWLSGRVARGWLEQGADVTCLARGGRSAPDGALLVTADRDLPGAYAAVADRDWDEVIDVSSDAAHAASAVTALADRTAHWTYISTISVYADSDTPHADEAAALLEPAQPGDEYDYGRAKVAAEASVRSALGYRAAIVRPGLIVGPGDLSDRFGYWVARFALAGDEPVLTPEPQGLGVSVIDIDDLADFIVEVGRGRWTGIANAVGGGMPLAAVLADARAVAGHTGALVAASDQWLAARGVSHWAGPRSLPLWLPRELVGHWSRSNTAYRILGGRLRPLRETLVRTLADERSRGLDRERRSGLSRSEELALLAELT